MSLNKEFRIWNKQHQNIITPYIKKIITLNNNTLIELSYGEGINHNTLYGVTIFKKTEKGFSNSLGFDDLNKCFDSLKDAEQHIKKIVKIYGDS